MAFIILVLFHTRKTLCLYILVKRNNKLCSLSNNESVMLAMLETERVLALSEIEL